MQQSKRNANLGRQTDAIADGQKSEARCIACLAVLREPVGGFEPSILTGLLQPMALPFELHWH